MALSEPSVAATIRIEEIGGDRWDVVVIGAGPAGAMAARELALGGANVLLVDRATFPRAKICGCCVNGAAMGVLAKVGLDDLLQRCHAQRLNWFRLVSGGRSADVRLTEGVSLSRERLDAALIEAAIQSGAQFLDGTQTLIGEATSDACGVILKTDSFQQVTSVKAIVVAGGLGCRVFAEAEADDREASQSSRVGAGTVLDSAPAEYVTGTIYMTCHRHGYVGLVRLEDNRLDIAAALDANAIKEHGGIPELIDKILTSSKLPIPPLLNDADWHGTGRLTQHRRQVVSERSFFIGDAAGYVEPFTGEGIAWALASGRAVAPIVLEFVRSGGDSKAMTAWMSTHHKLINSRARLCRIVSRLLRYPTLVNIAVRVLAAVPSLARPVVKSLNASFESTIPRNQRTTKQQ